MRDRIRDQERFANAPAPDPDDLPSVLQAQLDIQIHFIRDALSGGGPAKSDGLRGAHAERCKLLQNQSRTLWSRIGAYGRSDPGAIRLWAELAVALPDAVLVALCFEVERGRDRGATDPDILRSRAGSAYLHLLQRADSVLPVGYERADELLPLAVAVTAVRMGWRRGESLSWLRVEPAVDQVVEVVTRETRRRGRSPR